ncbi:unnamed protein product, partial [marine sediment metagenome]
AGSQEALSPNEPGLGYFGNALGEDASLTSERDMKTSGAEGSEYNLTTTLSQSPVVSGEADMIMNLNPIDETINRLRNKRQQYQDLLRQIDTELPH